MSWWVTSDPVFFGNEISGRKVHPRRFFEVFRPLIGPVAVLVHSIDINNKQDRMKQQIVLSILLFVLVSSHQFNPDLVNKRGFCGKRAEDSCELFADVTEGPYYIHSIVRDNITETQTGVPLRLEIDVTDVTSCDALTNAAVEIWHCSARGIYSAFNSNTNPSTTNSTFLRGIYPVNATGGVTFFTIFPGWYTGRVTHIHVKVHYNGTVNSTGYYTGGSVAHVGQLFFTDALVDEIAQLAPYNSNTNSMTDIDDDNIYEASGAHAILPYQLIGTNVSEGIVARISIGVNTSLSISSTADGGSDSSQGGGNSLSSAGGPTGGNGGSQGPTGGNGGTVGSSEAIGVTAVDATVTVTSNSTVNGTNANSNASNDTSNARDKSVGWNVAVTMAMAFYLTL
ncbi:hypothetical protein PROFUN_12836 [Planoprotostelium fungivorum]|uniref:Uncharacterized protein n=1 Tax=Planoprotostelium fungivorum TaxID=1890364 RepID=A0A2P6N6J5_9EUKA|nr:hypothetical protein PROFUN_12836 [Planoprotostelium fungivorum]